MNKISCSLLVNSTTMVLCFFVFQIKPYKFIAGEVLKVLCVFKCDLSHIFHTFLFFQFHYSAVDPCQCELGQNQRQETLLKSILQVNIWLMKGYWSICQTKWYTGKLTKALQNNWVYTLSRMCLWFCEDIHSDLFSCYRSSFFFFTYTQTNKHWHILLLLFTLFTPWHLLIFYTMVMFTKPFITAGVEVSRQPFCENFWSLRSN